jgi:hypothetical protein
VSSNHDLRHAHEDARNEAALRVRVLAAQEKHARDTALRRLVGVLVQRPEPHCFHACCGRGRRSSAPPAWSRAGSGRSLASPLSR